MSGHSKWSTIKRKKEKTDQQRAKIFTKMGREISIAVRDGGPDPASNSKLKDLIAKAKANNVPNDNIDRIIKKAAGGEDKNTYESINYEGYGPGGVAIIVRALTDNRNRTAADMRHYFDKYGAGLGTQGCVSFLFHEKGVIYLESEGVDEDALMECALEAGAADFLTEEEGYLVYTEPGDFSVVRDALEAAGYEMASAEVSMIPDNYVTLGNEEAIQKMEKLLEMLDEHDDVDEVFHNWEAPDED